MDENKGTVARRSRSLYTLAMVNTVVWAISIVALIFVMQRAPAVKSLFVILAGGTGVSILLLSLLGKLERSHSA